MYVLQHAFCLQDKDTELCGINVKVQQLEAELQDLSSQESKDEASLAKVKKQLRDLEAKVKDQEEELDEQAGNIQMLEQVQRGANMVQLGVLLANCCICISLSNTCLSHMSFICYVFRLSCGLRWRWRGSGRPTLKRLRVKMKT